MPHCLDFRLLVAPLFALSVAGAEIVINEIMFHPSGEPGLPEPVEEEFIELLNSGNEAISLDGWEFDAGVALVFPAITVPPGGFVVVVADPGQFAAKYPEIASPVVGPWSGRLSNSGENIRLRNALGEEVDELTYSDQGDWGVRRRGPLDSGHEGWVWELPADGEGGSLELVNPLLNNRRGQNWKSTRPGRESPGAINRSYSDDPPPMILEVKHSPAIPGEEDPVVITAVLSDLPGAPLNAVVSYGTDSNNPSGRAEVVMVDDGLNGDGDAGDGIFGATLPPFPDGTVVDFYVVASDGRSTRTWPGPTDASGTQGANALFQVESPAGLSDQGLPVYRLILSHAEEAEFDFSSFNSDSNARMNATFIAQIGELTEIRYLSGIRRRGAGSRRRNPRTCRLNLPSDRPWQGTTEMNLNAQFNYLQLVGQKFFAASRLPSANARAIEFFLNGNDQSVETERLFGAYVHLQPQGSDSVARQFPDDPNGNLYSKRRPDTQLAYRDGDAEAYQADGWSKATNRSGADWSDLDAWLQALQDPDNPNYLQNIEAVMDVEQWLRWFAVMALLANGETNISNGADDDYYVYAGRLDRRIKAVPHDLDTILGRGDGSAITDPRHTIYDFIESGDALAVLQPLIRHPEVIWKYHQVLRELIAGPFSKPKFDALLNQCLLRRVPASVREEMIAFMDARRAYVLEVVNPALTVTSNLPVEGGYARSLSARASLSGSFNLSETTRVTVNGRDAEIDRVAGTWSFGDPTSGQVPFINSGSTWQYLDNGSNQGTAWKEPAFDDSSWKTGNGEFGYGDGDETTDILYGPNASNFFNFFTNRNSKFVTTYFRREVTVADPTEFEGILLRLKSDDGAAVYVNGSLRVLKNLPQSPAFDTLASLAIEAPEEEEFSDFNLPTTAFVAGVNTIAVEVHQVARNDADLSFDLSLTGIQESSPGDQETLLTPGINALRVEAFNEEGGIVDSSSLTVWYDDGDSQSLSGNLGEDTTLTAEEGPYVIVGDLLVPSGVTLTIDPGTTLYFTQGARMTVAGRLLAEGTPDQRIQFTVAPGSGNRWDGLVFMASDEDSRMSNLDQSFATSGEQSIEVTNARLTLERVRWGGTSETILEVRHPKMTVLDCNFPPSDGHEVIHGTDLEGSEFFHLIGNIFQTSSGYNDIIDFSGGRRPGPVIYVIGNLFQGGTDDCLDLDGVDAHIEGNTFLNIHTDDPDRPSTSNAIATDGDAHLTIVRNIFDDVDHALLLKNESDAIFENNVVRKASLGAINFREPLRPEVAAGSDLFCRGNIFIDNAVTFRFPDHEREGGGTPNIEANLNILPGEEHQYGTGNLDADPSFADPDALDFSLLPGSPAGGSGVNGLDMGAIVPRGASVSGEPPTLTVASSASLVVSIPGISGIENGEFRSEYRWRWHGGPWSEDTEIGTPILLTDLTPGNYQVEVVGKDSNGVWQEVPTLSRAWTVVSDLSPSVQINELVADNGEDPDWVEFHNPGSAPFDLGGLVISDRPNGLPGRVFSGGTIVPAGGFLQVLLGNGFSLDREGEAFYLLNGLAVVDSVSFGHQLPGFSLSRLGPDGDWGLGFPTPSAPNRRVGTGDPRRLKINEWTAKSGVVVSDFVELYNPGKSPVAVGGFFLTDNPGGEITQEEIPPLSFVAAGGFLTLDFSMNSDSRNVALYGPSKEEIDLVAFTFQVEDTSYARLPDGSGVIGVSDLPTPGEANGSSEGINLVTRRFLFDLEKTWKYEESGQDLGMTWRGDGYDDALWPAGPGLLGFENDSLPGPGIATELRNPSDNDPYVITYYFRSTFEFNGDPGASALFLESVIDDGVVVYLNGQPWYRQGIVEDPSHDTFADASGEASLQGPASVSTEHLRVGNNVIAAEVHQTNAGSSDVVFGLALQAEEMTNTPVGDAGYFSALELVRNLRITELMFNPIAGGEFEFIELQNIGPGVLELEGVRLVEGIRFVFPAWSLAPGDFVLLVSDLAAFEREYGEGYPVAGQYEGQLSNGGEEVVLRLPAPFSANIQKFTYRDDWYPLADGEGASLEISDPSAPAREWNDRFSWRAGAVKGTPGSRMMVSAGTRQTIRVSRDATLNGTISGNWSPSLIWQQVAGPGPSVLSDAEVLRPSVTFAVPGTYRFRLSASDQKSVASAEAIVTVDDTYDDWKERYGLGTGILDDDDGDGINNLMEYALDLDPGSPDLRTPLEFVEGYFYYTRHLRKSDLVYQIECSPSLEEWSGRNDRLLFGGSDEQRRYYSFPEGEREFVRLRIGK